MIDFFSLSRSGLAPVGGSVSLRRAARLAVLACRVAGRPRLFVSRDCSHVGEFWSVGVEWVPAGSMFRCWLRLRLGVRGR